MNPSFLNNFMESFSPPPRQILPQVIDDSFVNSSMDSFSPPSCWLSPERVFETDKYRPEEGLKEASQLTSGYCGQNAMHTHNPYPAPFVSRITQDLHKLFHSSQVNGPRKIIESTNDIQSLTFDQMLNFSNEMLKTKNVDELIYNSSSINRLTPSPNKHLKTMKKGQKHHKDLSKRNAPNQNNQKIKKLGTFEKEKLIYEEDTVQKELKRLATRLKSWLHEARLKQKPLIINFDDSNICDLDRLLELIAPSKENATGVSQKVLRQNLEYPSHSIGSFPKSGDLDSLNIVSNHRSFNSQGRMKQNPSAMTVEQEIQGLDSDKDLIDTLMLPRHNDVQDIMSLNLDSRNYEPLGEINIQKGQFPSPDSGNWEGVNPLVNDQSLLKETNPYLNPIILIRLMAKYHHRKSHMIREDEGKLIERLSEYEESEEFRSSNKANWIDLIKYVEKKYYPKKIANETSRKIKAAIDMNLASHIGEVLYILLLKGEPNVLGFESQVDEMDLKFLRNNDEKERVFNNFMLLFKDQCATKNIVRPLMHLLAAFYLEDKTFKTSNEDEIKLMECVKNYQSENNWKSFRIYLSDTYITEADLVKATKLLARMLRKVLLGYETDTRIFEKLRETESGMCIKSKLLLENREDKRKLDQTFYLEVAFSEEDFQEDDEVYTEEIVGDLVHAMVRYLEEMSFFKDTDALYGFICYLKKFKKSNANWKSLAKYIKQYMYGQPLPKGYERHEPIEYISRSGYESVHLFFPPTFSVTGLLSNSTSQITWAWVFGHLLCYFIMFQPNLRCLKKVLEPIKSFAQHEKVLSLWKKKSDYDIGAKYKCIKSIYKDFRECYNGMRNYMRYHKNDLGEIADFFLNKEASWQLEVTSGVANGILGTSGTRDIIPQTRGVQQASQPAPSITHILNLQSSCILEESMSPLSDFFQEQSCDNEGMSHLMPQSTDNFFFSSDTTNTSPPNLNKRVKISKEESEQQSSDPSIGFERYKDDIDGFFETESQLDRDKKFYF